MALKMFEIIMRVIESCCLAFTLTYFFKIEQKRKIIVLAILYILSTCILSTFGSTISTALVVLISIVFLIYEHHHFDALYMLVPVVLVISNLLFNSFSTGWISFTVETSITLYPSLVILEETFSTILFGLFAFLLLSFTKRGQQLKKYWIYLPLVFLLIVMAVTLLSSVLNQRTSMRVMYILWIEFILVVLFSSHIFIVMNKQSKENADMTQRLAKEEVQKNMYNITQRSMNQISADKHMMIYTLMKINQMMSSKQDNEAKTFVKNELGKYTNYKSITSTGNPLFDYEISNIINQITARNIEVKSLFSINERNPILAEENTVYYIEKCLDDILRTSNDIEEIQLFFEEINSYLKVRVIVTYFSDSLDHRYYTFDKYDLLMNYKINPDVSYDEIIFLFTNK